MPMASESAPVAARPRATRLIIPGIALVFLAIGIASWDPNYRRWALLGVALYAVPLACCIVRSTMIRIWGLWFGVFLVVQTAISLLVPQLPSDYITLPPNTHLRVDIEAPNLPGLSGIHTYSTDEQGYRVAPRIDYARADALRIFAIGGSTTECTVLDDTGTWSYLLQEGLATALGKPVQIVNTGVSGLRARNHLATLRHVLDLHPAAVIFLVGANDWERQIRKHFATIPLWVEKVRLRQTLLGLALLRIVEGTVAPIGRPVDRDEVIVDNGDHLRPLQHSLDRPEKRRFTPSVIDPDYTGYLESISTLCHERNLPCIFVTQPTAHSPEASPEMRATFWMTPPYTSYTLPIEDMAHIAALYNHFLVDFARKHNDPVCDLASALAPTVDNFYDDFHFNQSGARNVAKYLVPCVAAALAAR